MSHLPTVDQAALVRLQGLGGDKLVTQMARLYLQNARDRLAQIDTFLNDGAPLSEAESGAHSLKSSSANVGAMQVNEICAEMEAAASRGEAERVAQLRGSLGTAVDESESRLRELLGGLEDDA